MQNDAQIAEEARGERASPMLMRMIFAGLAMMAFAAGLMWWRFGPSMFMDLVTAAANCF